MYQYYALASVYNHPVSKSTPISQPQAKSTYQRMASVAAPKIYLGSSLTTNTFLGSIESPTFYLTHFSPDEMLLLFPAQGITEHRDHTCDFNGWTLNHKKSFTAYKSPYVVDTSDCNSTSNAITRQCVDGLVTGDSTYSFTRCSEISSSTKPQCTLSMNKGIYQKGEAISVSWDTLYATSAYLYPQPKGKVSLRGTLTATANTTAGPMWFYLNINGPGGKTTCSKQLTVQ